MAKIDMMVQKLVELEDLKADAHRQIMLLRAELLEHMNAKGYDHAETLYAKISVGERHKYDLSEFATELGQLKDAYDSAKKDAEANAPFETEKYLLISRPKNEKKPGTYVSKKVKALKEGKIKI